MTFQEMCTTLLQRPGYLAVLENKRVWGVSPTGYLMDVTKAKPAYARIRLVDTLAATWECWTPEQLATVAAQMHQASE